MDYHFFVILSLILTEANSLKYTWATWTNWPYTCSTTCGSGKRCRQRDCVDSQGSIAKSPKKCKAYGGDDIQCTECTIMLQCPQTPGWGKWSHWSQCDGKYVKDKSVKDNCKKGKRTRKRLCDNPPPKDPTIFCDGFGDDISDCVYECDLTAATEFQGIQRNILKRVRSDHNSAFYRDKRNVVNVINVAPGKSYTLKCNTETLKFVQSTFHLQSKKAKHKAVSSNQYTIYWKRNSFKVFQSAQNEKHKSNKNKWKTRLHELDDIWNKKLGRSEPKADSTSIIYETINNYDSGLYSCHLKFGDFDGLAKLVFLYVKDLVLEFTENESFHLHSNLGVENLLQPEYFPMFDAAMISWYLNEELKFRGLASSFVNRVYFFGPFNHTLVGQWKCYLEIPVINPTGFQLRKDAGMKSKILINKFIAKVGEEQTLDAYHLAFVIPNAYKLMFLAIFATICLLIAIILLILTAIYSFYWVNRTASLTQIKLIIQEKFEDYLRWFILVQRRAEVHAILLKPYNEALENRSIKMWRDYLLCIWKFLITNYVIHKPDCTCDEEFQ